MKLQCVLIISYFGWAHCAYAEAPLSVDDPNALRFAIEHSYYNEHGLNNFMQRLTKGFDAEDSPYQKVLAHIRTGEDEWLKVADTIGACTGCIDSATAEEYEMALKAAFIHAPEAILHRYNLSSLNQVCTIPLIEPTKEEYDDYLNALKAAVKQVKDPALWDKKVECNKLIGAIKPWSDE